jgi:hypothetical protein
VVIAQFLHGHVINVSRKKRRRKRRERIHLEQLEGFDEMWALCDRTRRPGHRLAGRFVDYDVFAIFRIYDKLDIGNDYRLADQQVRDDWVDCLGLQLPHSGLAIPDYISEPFNDMDQTQQP